MHYIHKENYMHRDLKPDNIMITENLTAKIGDFGMIKKY
jgi:serine/threonine protein kinase